ncbi:9631_t:CDS:2, partial [Paraglomus brasilianum]
MSHECKKVPLLLGKLLERSKHPKTVEKMSDELESVRQKIRETERKIQDIEALPAGNSDRLLFLTRLPALDAALAELQLFAATEPLSKCRKIEDESLSTFWQALKDVEVNDDQKFLQLSKDIYFLGQLVWPSILFVRECYRDLEKTVFDDNIMRLRITGNP